MLRTRVFKIRRASSWRSAAATGQPFASHFPSRFTSWGQCLFSTGMLLDIVVARSDRGHVPGHPHSRCTAGRGRSHGPVLRPRETGHNENRGEGVEANEPQSEDGMEWINVVFPHTGEGMEGGESRVPKCLENDNRASSVNCCLRNNSTSCLYHAVLIASIQKYPDIGRKTSKRSECCSAIGHTSVGASLLIQGPDSG